MTQPFKVLYVGPKSEAFDAASLEQQSRAILHAGGAVIRYGGNSATELIQALQEVETGLVRFRTARARVERIQDAASASARAADLARLRFEGGVADFLQVLDAERTQLDAEDQLAQAHIDAATSYAALYKALGGQLPEGKALR